LAVGAAVHFLTPEPRRLMAELRISKAELLLNITIVVARTH
jgi:hypothetical protein